MLHQQQSLRDLGFVGPDRHCFVGDDGVWFNIVCWSSSGGILFLWLFESIDDCLVSKATWTQYNTFCMEQSCGQFR